MHRCLHFCSFQVAYELSISDLFSAAPTPIVITRADLQKLMMPPQGINGGGDEGGGNGIATFGVARSGGGATTDDGDGGDASGVPLPSLLLHIKELERQRRKFYTFDDLVSAVHVMETELRQQSLVQRIYNFLPQSLLFASAATAVVVTWSGAFERVCVCLLFMFFRVCVCFYFCTFTRMHEHLRAFFLSFSHTHTHTYTYTHSHTHTDLERLCAEGGAGEHTLSHLKAFARVGDRFGDVDSLVAAGTYCNAMQRFRTLQMNICVMYLIKRINTRS
jgi:hypothetical protein